MNQKTAKKLKKLCFNSDGTFNRDRYQAVKSNWNKVPSNHRNSLMAAMEESARWIKERNLHNSTG